MKIALAQMEVLPNQPKKNLEKMLHMIEDAKRQEVDLIAFPEMCVGGYLVGDKWLSDDFCLDLMEYNEEILKASEGRAVAFGNIYLDRPEEIKKRIGDNAGATNAGATNANAIHPNKDGRTRKYNAVYVVQNGKFAERVFAGKAGNAKDVRKNAGILPEGVQPKTLLPNYRFFDDMRYFFSLEDIAKDFGEKQEDITQPFMIEVKGMKEKKVAVGFELCEDLWCADYRKDGEAVNPTKMLIRNGAESIVNLSASPWTFGKNGARDRRVQFLKKDCVKENCENEGFVPFFYVNCTGAQNNGKDIVTFDG